MISDPLETLGNNSINQTISRVRQTDLEDQAAIQDGHGQLADNEKVEPVDLFVSSNYFLGHGRIAPFQRLHSVSQHQLRDQAHSRDHFGSRKISVTGETLND